MTLVNNFPVHGSKRDYSGCQALNTGLFSEFKQMGTVKWVSAGGDHSTDFWGTYNGINLSYGRKTGFGSYGPKFAKRGARVFEIDVDPNRGDMHIESWIRQQDGSIDEQGTPSPPSPFSWLNKNYCHGAEELHSQLDDVLPMAIPQDSGWIPSFV